MALALFASLARAAIPVGFMPAVNHHHVQLVICDGGNANAAHHAHHAHAGASSHSVCPFALSGGAAPLPEVLDATVALAASVLTVPFFTRTLDAETPPRYSAPRGPPAFS